MSFNTNNNNLAPNVGLKKMTKHGSVQVRLDKGGKKYINDNSKPKRIYKTNEVSQMMKPQVSHKLKGEIN